LDNYLIVKAGGAYRARVRQRQRHEWGEQLSLKGKRRCGSFTPLGRCLHLPAVPLRSDRIRELLIWTSTQVE